MAKNRAHAVSFTAGGLTLSGVLHLPKNQPLAVVVGCHGLMANKNSPKQIELAIGCSAIGIAYFRFDHRGCGHSEGLFESDTTLENRHIDLSAAVNAAKNALGKDIPIGLFGSSLGGTVCLTTAPELSPFAIVTLAAPVHSRSIHIPENSPQSLKNELGKHQLAFNITDGLAAIHHILIVHGSNDRTVSVENAHTIYRLAQDPKRELVLTGGDHRISNTAHQKIFLQESIQWFADCVT